jgi:ketosteroid isomerase-like protein
MRRSLMAIVFLSFAAPSLVSAQRWTEEEQDLLTHVKACWDAWAEAVNQKDHSLWRNVCHPEDEFVGWWVSDGAPWTMEAEVRSFDQWVSGVEHFYWENLQPFEIKVLGDIGMIWFYVTYREPGSDGPLTRFENKRLEIYRMADGGWHWLGAMVQSKEVGDFVDDGG